LGGRDAIIFWNIRYAVVWKKKRRGKGKMDALKRKNSLAVSERFIGMIG
jgi:hypothetical protein